MEIYTNISTAVELIRLFGCWVESKSNHRNRSIINAAKNGYIPHPDVVGPEVDEFIKEESFNPNTTFYRTWDEVTKKTRVEILVDQIIHYATTYGTDFMADAWVPNREPLFLNYNQYKVITKTTPEELYKKAITLISSNVALSDDTIGCLLDFVVCMVNNGYELDINAVGNKDIRLMLSDRLGITPTTPTDMIRWLFHKFTGLATPIQSKENLRKISCSDLDINLADHFNEAQQVILSSMFRRYKRFFIAIKKGTKQNNNFINHLRKLADKHHTSFRPAFWDNLTNTRYCQLPDIKKALDGLDNNFKIIRLINMIATRRGCNKNAAGSMYLIRNGKIFIQPENIPAFDPHWWNIRAALILKLIHNIAPKKETYVKFPENINLACPTSERQFIGNIPIGSWCDMENPKCFIGIYWENGWGAHDFDLHYASTSGMNYGWNGDYNGEVVFSGDMTDAPGGASELFSFTHGVMPGVVTVNRYCGIPGSRYKVFLGNGTGKVESGMVDTNAIVFDSMLTSGAAEQVIGVVADNKFHFTSLQSINRQVPNYTDNPGILSAIIHHFTNYLPLKPILIAAGYKIWNTGMEKEPDIDLSTINRDTIIKLFG